MKSRAFIFPFILFFNFSILFSAQYDDSKVRIISEKLQIIFNDSLYSQIIAKLDNNEKILSDFSCSEYIEISGKRITQFIFENLQEHNIKTSLGSGKEYIIEGITSDSVQKQIIISVYKNLPSLAFFKVKYTNFSSKILIVNKWVNHSYKFNSVKGNSPIFWSFQGATYEDRRDWIQPLNSGFYQKNYMGMNASDYGGGTPIVDVWRKDIGLAVGIVETKPKLINMPVSMDDEKNGVNLNIEFDKQITLKHGETLETFETFVSIHKGDYFTTLKNYKKIMEKKGLVIKTSPIVSYKPQWCGWGYGRDFTVDEILNSIPKVKEVGFEWVVIDDGWQNNIGDWKPNHIKFPRSDEDMKALVDKIHSKGLKAKLWWAPLAAHPSSEIFNKQPDMLLLNQDSSKRNITWWDSYYLCPDYEKTIDYSKSLIIKFLKYWGFDGLKIDGQHLNAVPACYNPVHNHDYPEKSIENLSKFWETLYKTANSIKKDVVIELCPCGTNFCFYNLPFINQTVASDPLSSWQIRLKGKTFKALMGANASYFGDHIELSDNGNDWASVIGIGAIMGSKFTLPVSEREKNLKERYDLTKEKELEWEKWIKIYKKNKLSMGTYLGELYDIGFDKPETHAIQKNKKMYYAFYAQEFNGSVELRGLDNKVYRVIDYVNNIDLGTIKGPNANLYVRFNKFLLIKCVPI